MKGKEGSGDPEGREAKSGLASSGCGLDTSAEKGFFADVPGIICLEVLRNIPRLYAYNHILRAISKHYISQTRSPNHNDNVTTILKSYLLR